MSTYAILISCMMAMVYFSGCGPNAFKLRNRKEEGKKNKQTNKHIFNTFLKINFILFNPFQGRLQYAQHELPNSFCGLLVDGLNMCYSFLRAG